MNLKELRELIELVSEKGFAEFEIERQGFRLRICRFKEPSNSGVQPIIPPVLVTSPLQMPLELPAQAAAEGDSRTAVESSAPVAAPAADLHVVRSPIVGTFYRAPAPTSEPFVNVGDRVEPETVLCIIEAMKLMNEIQAEVSGTVVEVHVNNAQPVEYGQPLFSVRP